jgi:hypothetical protein
LFHGDRLVYILRTADGTGISISKGRFGKSGWLPRFQPENEQEAGSDRSSGFRAAHSLK